MRLEIRLKNAVIKRKVCGFHRKYPEAKYHKCTCVLKVFSPERRKATYDPADR